ncbi:MAG: hypothetical protein V1703_03195 [Candidatus Altiarchaeota archaeon]
MYNCGMCGRPTRNPQAICELCVKAKERTQKREQRRDERVLREAYNEDWAKAAEEKEEDTSEVWADESMVDLKKKPKAR